MFRLPTNRRATTIRHSIGAEAAVDSIDGGLTAKPAWYAKGLRFECTQCGNCCSGGPGAVWFTLAEEEAMAKELELTLEVFHARYTRRIGARYSLKELLRNGAHDCVFLDRDTQPGKAICSIYHARPTQCRTWPWWSEVMESPAAWEDTKQRTPCPGMNKGTLHSLVEITIGLSGGA
ncbi:MAG: YkgJ family cysteine cluster protein [Planctomycetota bacterium]|nr:MAG: YkgJ family cysteine cluster protein [Planctomycetota bacterium]